MTPGFIWHALTTGRALIAADSLWERVTWQTVWSVPLVGCVCAVLRRHTPAVRAWLWWLCCVQMLAVCFSVLPAMSVAVFEGDSRLPRCLMALWTLGVTVRGILLVVQFRRTQSLLRECATAPDCAATEAAALLAMRLALHGRLTVLVSPRLKIPALVGLWRSALMLPTAALNGPMTAELRMALAHELAHLRRRDLWLGVIPVCAQGLLFFHPLIWVAVREYCLAREEACDTIAQRVTGTEPAAYGAMLLRYVTSGLCPNDKKDPLRLRFQFLQRRLIALQPPAKKTHSRSLAAICALCVFCAACLSLIYVVSPLSSQRQGVPRMSGVRDAYSEQLTKEFSEDTTYSQPVILPPKHHRPVLNHSVAVYERIAQANTAEKGGVPHHGIVITRLRKHVSSAHTGVAKWPVIRPSGRVVRSHPTLLASGIPNDKTPHAMVVADSGVTPIQNPLESPDLETMDTTLKALKKQMKQKIAPKTAVDTGPASGVQEQQTQAQSGPQFQQHWKHHIMEFRIDVESDAPTIQMQDTSVMMPPGSQPAPTQLPDPPQSIRRISPAFRGKIILEFRPSLPNIPSISIVM